MYLLVFDVGQRRCDNHTVNKDVRTHLYYRLNVPPVQSASESDRVRSCRPARGVQWRFLSHGVTASTPVQCPVCIIILIRPVAKSSSVNLYIGQFLARSLCLLAPSIPAVHTLFSLYFHPHKAHSAKTVRLWKRRWVLTQVFALDTTFLGRRSECYFLYLPGYICSIFGAFLNMYLHIVISGISGVPRGVCLGGSNPPPRKFRSFDKAEPNSLFRGKYIRNCLVFLFHRPN
jgi:hypothetical protein